MMPTVASLFSGGGLADVGYQAAGFTPIAAVEFKADIAAVYARNLGDHIQVADVRSVDWSAFPVPDLLHASPVCTNVSVANQRAGETELDIECARAAAAAVETLRPNWFCLENVMQYRPTQSYRLIVAALERCGYCYQSETINAAAFGVPQTRKRLILRASRVGHVRPMEPTHRDPKTITPQMGLFGDLPPWRGWYQAIEDLLPGLEECSLAKWQLERVPAEIREALLVGNGNCWGDGINIRTAPDPSFTLTGECCDNQVTKAVLLDCKNGARDEERGGPTLKTGADPCFTIGADNVGSHCPTALLVGNGRATADGTILTNTGDPSPTLTARSHEQGTRSIIGTRVVRLSARCLARFQSVPDWYVLPDNKRLASTIIGNGVCCLLAQRIGESFLRS